MNTDLNFLIETSDIKELLNDLHIYPQLKIKVQTLSESKENIKKHIEKIEIAELNTKISVLYYYYHKGILAQSLQNMLSDPSNNKALPKISFGSYDKQCQVMSKLCKMLSELDIEHIASTQTKSDMYHKITEIICSSKTNRHNTVLINPEFWIAIFQFYDEYQKL